MNNCRSQLTDQLSKNIFIVIEHGFSNSNSSIFKIIENFNFANIFQRHPSNEEE